MNQYLFKRRIRTTVLKFFGVLAVVMFLLPGQASAAWSTQSVFTATPNSISMNGIAYGTYLGSPIYVATGNDWAIPASPVHYAAKSSDGVTWTTITNLPAGPQIWGAVIANDVIIINSEGFIARSGDGGVTWTDVTANIAQTATEIVFEVLWDAGTSTWIAFEGVFSVGGVLQGYQMRTSANGLTWSTALPSNLPAVMVDRGFNDGVKQVLTFTDPAGTPSADNWGFIGVTDVQISTTLPNFAAATAPPVGLSYPSFTDPITGHAGGTPVMLMVGKNAAGNGAVSTSSDHGVTWSAATATGTPPLGSVVWNPIDSTFIAEDINGDLYSSVNGATGWTSMGISLALPGWVPTLSGGVSDGTNVFILVGNEIRTIAKRTSPVDFNGDGTSDIVVYRGGAWLFHDFVTGAQTTSVWTGSPGTCIPAPMDYNGDGAVEFTQLCDGSWNFYNADGTYNKGIWTGGVAGDLPVPADYNGDGTDDVVIFRNGAWLFYDFATGAQTTGVWTGSPLHWTGGTPTPVPMDYDGDGAADMTVYSGGPWHFYNADGSYNKGVWTGGVPGDMPVPADYDGNGTDDIVVFRAGAWLTSDFTSGAQVGAVWTGSPPHWNGGTSLPSPLDYDGDGAVDMTVYSGGPWHFFNADGSYNKGVWTGGVAGDLPISGRLLP